MKIISFAWTTPALIAGAKTVTRREWTASYARTFYRQDFVRAYDRSPRAGGKQVGTIELTVCPYQEHVGLTHADEYRYEGLAWMEEHGLKMPSGLSPLEFWKEWQRQNPLVWVVRFKLVEISSP